MEACPHCGMMHQTTCPRIRKIEYHADGTTKAIEFHAPQPVVVSSPPQPIPPAYPWPNYPMPPNMCVSNTTAGDFYRCDPPNYSF